MSSWSKSGQPLRRTGGGTPRRRAAGSDALRRRSRSCSAMKRLPETRRKRAAQALPALAELVAAERGQDVRLVVLEEALDVVGGRRPRAARERVGDPAEDVLVGLVPDESLEPDDAPRPLVLEVPGTTS